MWSEKQDFAIKENMERKYTTSSARLDQLKQLSVTNKDIMELETLAKTAEGNIISLVHLSANLTNHEIHEPHVLLIGGVHGNEPVGAELLMRFIRHITTGEYITAQKMNGTRVEILLYQDTNCLVWTYSFSKITMKMSKPNMCL